MRKIHKKGGVVGDLVNGATGLVIMTIIVLVIVSTILGANLLTTGSVEKNTTDALGANLTAGIDNVSSKLPTILLIGAVVLLFGVIVILVRQSQAMGIGGRGGSL
jgi:hypothetical protein